MWNSLIDLTNVLMLWHVLAVNYLKTDFLGFCINYMAATALLRVSILTAG